MANFFKRGYWKLTGVPFVTTLHKGVAGHHRCDELEKLEGGEEDHRAKATWVEYRKEGELVHRSVNIELKQGVDLGAFQSQLG